MQPIYIDVSDEITTAIERLKKSEAKDIAFVIPKGAILLQSIVNLKLIKKAAVDSKKELTLVTTDKIGRNLASQVGLPVISRLDAAGKEEEEETAAGESEPHIIGGVKVHRYYEDREEEREKPEGEDLTPADNSSEETKGGQPIVPRGLFRGGQTPTAANEPEPAEEESALPIVVRPITTRAPESKEETKEKEDSAEAPIVPLEKPAPIEAETAEEKKAEEEKTEGEPAAVLASDQEPPLEKPVPPRRNRRKLWFFALYLMVLLLIGAGTVSAYFLPSSTVTIHLKPVHWQKEIPVSATVGATTATSPSLIVPAEVITGEATAQLSFNATGSKEEGNTATGTAQLSYIYDGTPQSVPSGTTLQAGGLTFTTTADATVPGAQVKAGVPVAGTATVAITASQPGATSNLSNTPATLGLSGSHIYAQIISTTGGTNKEVAVITQTDIANAKASLDKQLQQATQAKLADLVKKRSLLFDPSTDQYSLDSFTSSSLAGTEAGSGTVSGKASSKRLVIDLNTLNQAVQQQLQQSKAADQTILIDNVTPAKLVSNLSGKSAAFVVDVTGRATQTISTDSLRQQLPGKSLADATNLIHLINAGATVTVEQNPGWWPNHNLPFSSRYLRLLVKYE